MSKELTGGVRVLIILFVIALAVGLFLLEATLFMLLWNWLMPLVWASAPQITWVQGMGAVMLLSLIGSFFRRK